MSAAQRRQEEHARPLLKRREHCTAFCLIMSFVLVLGHRLKQMTLVIRCANISLSYSHTCCILKPQPVLASIVFVNEDALMTVKTGDLHAL